MQLINGNEHQRIVNIYRLVNSLKTYFKDISNQHEHFVCSGVIWGEGKVKVKGQVYISADLKVALY